MINPKISVIIPVYNGEFCLEDTLRALRDQTLMDYEVIFADDGSQDRSSAVIQNAMKEDHRIRLLSQAHAGAGSARNMGLTAARGEYVIFSDCDDLYLPHTLEDLYTAAVSCDADIVACNYCGIDTRGKEFRQTGVNLSWLPENTTVFSYRNCPKDILRIAGTMVWNKMYRRAFLTEKGLQFDALLTCNDLSFVAVSLASAEKVTCIPDHLIRYHFPRLNNPKNISDISKAVDSAFCQIGAMPHFEHIRGALLRFGIDHLIGGLKKEVRDFSAPDAQMLYQQAHDLFRSEIYAQLDGLSLRNGNLYREFQTVQKHGYETMKAMVRKKLIVSLTTYPKRIGTLRRVLNTIYAQTKQPDMVILWLAREQFPGMEADVPGDLMELVRQNKLMLRWCDDLKPHKKYFYTFQEYPHDLVVTIDDDLLYSPDTLSCLYASYLLHPYAVSTCRAHLMLQAEDGALLPYNAWIQETDTCLHQPSMQLLATGGAGGLYSPELFRKEFFDKQAIIDTCLWADDLWLKAMELLSEIPVVLARGYEPLQYLPDTQEDSLQTQNVHQGQNDVQLKKILRWTDEKFGSGSLMAAFVQPWDGNAILGMEQVSWHIDRERRLTRARLKRTRQSLDTAQTDLKQSRQDNGRANAQLQQLRGQLEQKESSLSQLRRELINTREELAKTQEKLRKAEENAPIGKQLKNLGTEIQGRRAGDNPISHGIKNMVYLLAWVPEKLLAGMMFYLKNGAKQTLRKLFPR